MLAGWCMTATGDDPQGAAATWLARNIYGPIIELIRARHHLGGWLFELTEDSSALSGLSTDCLLYTSDAADQRSSVDLGGRGIIKKKNSGELGGRRTVHQKKNKTNN